MDNISSSLKLLLVDDDEVDRMIVKRSLRSAKLEADITPATMGGEALQLLEQTTFDCIFVDFMLPDMNGLELLQKIREKGITTPVLIVTSQGDERIAVDAIKTGASDYLPKTLLTPEGVAKSISSAIKLYKAEQERLATQQQLRQTQEQLDLVIAGAPIILWATDQQGTFTMSKGKGLALIGVKESESVGVNVFDKYPFHTEFLNRIQQALDGQESRAVLNFNGVWYDFWFMPFRNEHNQIAGMIGVAYDVSERIQIEEELKRAKDSALNMAQIKEQFLANMSHEIRTPMNGIIGLTKVLEKTPLDNQQQEYLNAIKTSANNLMVIINDLLDFSKIEAGKITLEMIPFDLRKLVKQLLEILEIKAKERNNTLKLLIDTETPQYVIGDPVRLSQILNNLLGNALKFTENGTVRLSIEVMAQEADRHFLEFSVQDNGIGIAENKLNSIFDKFTQGSNDTTRKFGGTGLGLSISKELIEVLNGKISVQSEVGRGSTFQFVLPFQKAEDSQLTTNNNSQVKEAENTSYANLKGAKILLAEDNAINQMLVKKVVTDYGMNLKIANNGKEAIEYLEQDSFDLVLMDIQMPEMDGYEAMHHIRENMPHVKHIPIIALTAHATQGEATKCIVAGANSYVSKPFEAETLLNEISSFIESTKPIKAENKVELPPSKDNNNQGNSLQVDLAFLRAFADGNVAFMQDIIHLFIQQTPGQLNELTTAVSQSNWAEVRTIAHKLKSSLALIGIKPLEEVNLQIEKFAFTRTNVDQIPSLTQNLTTLIEQAIKQLQVAAKELV